MCWERGELLDDLKNAIIVLLYNNKGEKSDCSNYRGSTLLSIHGTILTRVLLNRLTPAIAEDILPFRYDPRTSPNSREVQGAEHGPLRSLRRPDEGF